MSDDIVKRLLKASIYEEGSADLSNLGDEAADEIERLRAALFALSRPDGFARLTDAQDRQARIDYARRALGEPKP